MNSDVFWSGAFALIGVIIGSALSWGIEWQRERRATGRSRLLVAALCSAELRIFAERCEDVAYDDGTYMGQMAGRYENGEEYLEPQVSEPDLPTWPADMRWDAIDSKDVQIIFRLPIERRRMLGALGDTRLNDFPPFGDTFAERQSGYARMALHVLNIARRLETSAGLTPPDEIVIRGRLETISHRFPQCSAGRELGHNDRP